VKKILISGILIAFLFICGCKNVSSDVTAVTSGLSFTAKTEIDNCITEYKVEIKKQGNMKITAEKPESIKGITAEFVNNNITFTYNGLEYNTDATVLPEGNVMGLIYNVFSDNNLNDKEINFKDDEIYITGKNGEYNYKLFIGQTGLPLGITEKSGTEIIIKNATLIK